MSILEQQMGIKNTTIVIVVLIVATMLFMLAVSLYGFPTRWESHRYNPVMPNALFVNYTEQQTVDKMFEHNFVFDLYLKGKGEDPWSGGSPFHVAIVAKSNRLECQAWEIISVQVVKNGDVDSEFTIHGHQMTWQTEMTYGDAKMYELGTWKSDQPLDLVPSSDSKVTIVFNAVLYDENSVKQSIQIEKEFVSQTKSGWFKARF